MHLLHPSLCQPGWFDNLAAGQRHELWLQSCDRGASASDTFLTSDEPPASHTQYYFGIHILKKLNLDQLSDINRMLPSGPGASLTNTINLRGHHSLAQHHFIKKLKQGIEYIWCVNVKYYDQGMYYKEVHPFKHLYI